MGSASGGTETDSGVPTGRHESVRDRHGTVKALRGSRRTKKGSHPRRCKDVGPEVRRTVIGRS
jgi:hypothetical protein